MGTDLLSGENRSVPVLLMLIHDWRTNRKIRGGSSMGAAFVFVPQLLYPLLVNSAAFASFAHAVGELSGYR